MSSRARRLAVSSSTAVATPVASWLEAVADGAVPAAGRRPAQRVMQATAAALTAMAAPGVPQPPSAAQVDEETYARGFAEGQQAAAAAAQQETAMLARKLASSPDVEQCFVLLQAHGPERLRAAFAYGMRQHAIGAEYVCAQLTGTATQEMAG